MRNSPPCTPKETISLVFTYINIYLYTILLNKID